MKTMLRLIVLLFVLGGWGLAALALHVVRLPESQHWIGIVPKNRLHWNDTYLDVRNWTPAEVHAHPAFVRRVIDTEKTHWLIHAVPDPKTDVATQLVDIVQNGPPATQPADSLKQADKPTSLPPRFTGVR